MRRAWMVAILILAAGCGDDEMPPGGLGDACNTVDDCGVDPTELFCVPIGSGTNFTRMCTISCSSDDQCSVFGGGVECVDREGKCMYTCVGGSRCPNGGACVNEACVP